MADGSPVRRRAVLAGSAGALASLSGCVGDLRNLVGRQRPRQLSLEILAMPAAEDPYAVRIANILRENLQAAGINATVDIRQPDVLYRDILVNHNFELYVGQYPGGSEPDELRSLLYSTYGEEPGWQNPFGYSNISLDDAFDEQQNAHGDERLNLVYDIQREIIEEQPFTVLAFPDRLAATRSDRFDPWAEGGMNEPADYLALRSVSDAATLEMVLRDARITRNRNPIAAEHRDPTDVTGLLYEPLMRDLSDEPELTPWLARSVEWEDDGDVLAATVTLRETKWHDEESVTAADIAFTYTFLQDTSLGTFDTPAPTGWRRGRVTLVEEVTELDERSVRMRFSTPTRAVAERALTAPILPEHVWEARSSVAELGPITVAGQTTEALVTSNEEAVGSGALQFVDATADQELLLEPFEAHFLYTGDTGGLPERFQRQPQFETVRFTVAPSHNAAVELLAENQADATADGLGAQVVSRVIRHEELSLSVGRTTAFYHVGYNTRTSPLGDPWFRRAVSQLLDREHLHAAVFEGYATPRQCPLADQWVPDELQWDGTARLPFPGEDGELDVESARSTFREAGYHYEGDSLIRRGPQ